MLHHDGKKFNNDLGRRSDEDLSLAALLSIADGH